jgi:hypothetical protein
VVAQQCILVELCCVVERVVKDEGPERGESIVTRVTIKRWHSEYSFLESHSYI